MKTKVIVVIGPTAVGKTALGIDLAQRYNGEIISGDSQQVYRELDIGTAKASPEEQAVAVHHLIDVRDVNEGYSANDFWAPSNSKFASEITSGRTLEEIVCRKTESDSIIFAYRLASSNERKGFILSAS